MKDFISSRTLEAAIAALRARAQDEPCESCAKDTQRAVDELEAYRATRRAGSRGTVAWKPI